jgi:hypothetical protein
MLFTPVALTKVPGFLLITFICLFASSSHAQETKIDNATLAAEALGLLAELEDKDEQRYEWHTEICGDPSNQARGFEAKTANGGLSCKNGGHWPGNHTCTEDCNEGDECRRSRLRRGWVTAWTFCRCVKKIDVEQL